MKVTKNFKIIEEQGENRNYGIPTDEELALINSNTITPLNADDVFVFKVELCDNEVDRVGDAFTINALNSIEEKSKTLVGVKDHEWESGNSMARLYDTAVVEDGTVNEKNGLQHGCVVGKAYTLRKYEDFVDKVSSGILKEVSISFESVGDKCSICGGLMTKGDDDKGHCENGHIALETYDGQLCYNIIDNVTDMFEWSFVAVPCQRAAGVKSKTLGGKLMKKFKFLMNTSSTLKSLDDEQKAEIESILEVPADAETSEEDIKALFKKIEELEAENKSLKEALDEANNKSAELEQAEQKRFKMAEVEKQVKALEPLTEQVERDILDKIDLDNVVVDESGNLDGLNDQIEHLKEVYKGLIGKGCGQKEEKPDADEGEKAKGVKSKGFSVPKFTAGGRSAEVKEKKSFMEACNKTFNK